MKTLLLGTTVALVTAALVGCAGDTSSDDEEQDQTSQAFVGQPRAGLAAPDVRNGNVPNPPVANHRPPQAQAATDDPTQQVEGR